MAFNVKHAVTEKLGPFPAWAWVGIGVGAYLIYKHLKGGSSSNANNSLGYQQSYVPLTSAGNQSSTGSTPVSLSCPAGQQIDPTGTFCTPNSSLCGPGTGWQNGQCIPSVPQNPCGPAIGTCRECGPDEIQIFGPPSGNPSCAGQNCPSCIPKPPIPSGPPPIDPCIVQYAACVSQGGRWTTNRAMANGCGTCDTSPVAPTPGPPPPGPPPIDPCIAPATLCQASGGSWIADRTNANLCGTCAPASPSTPAPPPTPQPPSAPQGCGNGQYLSADGICVPFTNLVACWDGSLQTSLALCRPQGNFNAGPINNGMQNNQTLSQHSTYTPPPQPNYQIVNGPGPGILYMGGHWVRIAG